jgi:hypothetical protein
VAAGPMGWAVGRRWVCWGVAGAVGWLCVECGWGCWGCWRAVCVECCVCLCVWLCLWADLVEPYWGWGVCGCVCGAVAVAPVGGTLGSVDYGREPQSRRAAGAGHSRAPRGWLLLWALSVLSVSVAVVLLPVSILFLWREAPEDLPALHSREHWRHLP